MRLSAQCEEIRATKSKSLLCLHFWLHCNIPPFVCFVFMQACLFNWLPLFVTAGLEKVQEKDYQTVDKECKKGCRSLALFWERRRIFKELRGKTVVIWLLGMIVSLSRLCHPHFWATFSVNWASNGLLFIFKYPQVYYERVNSYTTGSAYNFAAAGCRDMSRQLIDLENFPATKIRFTKGFSFDCADAEADFEGQRGDFFQENELRDDYMECREGMDLLNMRPPEYVIAMGGGSSQKLPWYLSHCCFLLGSLLLLSWPMRVLIEYKTAYLHYHIHKVFGHNFTDSEQSGVADSAGNRMLGAHRRPVSISSAELDFFITTNLQQLPSYSEALLMPLPEQQRLLHPPNGAPMNNEALLITNPLCQNNSGGDSRSWGENQNCSPAQPTPCADEQPQQRLSNTTHWFRRHTCRNRPLRHHIDSMHNLRRNTSDSYIVQHCQQPSLSPSAGVGAVIIEENSAVEEAERDHQDAVEQELLPDYETALFLPKVSVSRSLAAAQTCQQQQQRGFLATFSQSASPKSQPVLVRGAAVASFIQGIAAAVTKSFRLPVPLHLSLLSADYIVSESSFPTLTKYPMF